MSFFSCPGEIYKIECTAIRDGYVERYISTKEVVSTEPLRVREICRSTIAQFPWSPTSKHSFLL